MWYDDYKQKAAQLSATSIDEMQEEIKRRETINNPFPLDVFHPNLKPFINALVEKYDIPPSYVGLTLLSAYSTAIGSRYVVTPNGVDKMYLPVWSCLVGGSSSGKSLCYSKIFQPIDELQWEYEIENNELTAGMTDDKIRQAAKKWLVFRDVHMATVIKRILMTNPKGVLKDADELLEWINGMNMLSNKEGTDEQVWISSWDCKKYSKLLGDNKTITVPRPFMNVFGGIQPTLVWKLFKNDRDTSGFVFRLLFAMPQEMKIADPDPSYVLPDEFTKPHRNAIRMLHKDLPVENDIMGIPADPDVCKLHPHAVQDFTEWYRMKAWGVNKIEDEKDRMVQQGIYGKMKAYCLRFSAILHLMDKALNTKDFNPGMVFRPEELVEQRTMDRAIKLADYFFTSAVEAYERVDQSVTAPYHVLRVAGYVSTGMSMQRIAELLYPADGTTEKARKRAARLVQKYIKDYPKVFKAQAK